MKTYNIDETDEQIIKLLTQNSRMSVVEISNQVGISRVAINQRMSNLEKHGIIEQYSIVVNSQKLGRTISAYFDIEAEPNKIFQVAEKLAQSASITDIYVMTGSSNLHVHGLMNINEDLTTFLEKELYTIDGIISVDCKLILSRIKVRNSMRI